MDRRACETDPSDEAGAEAAAAKASFTSVYDAPTPAPYFASLRPLDYRTPAHAQPVIRRALADLARLRGRARPQMLDLCSGYGVNGALAKCDTTLDALYRRYADPKAAPSAAADRAELAAHRRPGPVPRVIGQDVAGNALAYATAAGFLDAAIEANLEARPLSPREAALVADTDLVTITGGLSYIGEATLGRVLAACRRRPWVLYFPLRGTGLEGIEAALETAGLLTERWGRPFPHRRYADARERRETLADLSARPDEGLGAPSRTHLEAVLHLARPAEEAGARPLPELVLARPPLSRRAPGLAVRGL